MMPATDLDGIPLATLLGADAVPGPLATVRVHGLAVDSRSVDAGFAFVALTGSSAHGLDYLDDALARGARVVMHDSRDPRWSELHEARCRAAAAEPVPVQALAEQLGSIAARFHGDPSAAFEHVVAVTGTDGKTSVSHFVASMLDDGDAPAGVLGTLGTGRAGRLHAATLTTPDAVSVQAAFACLRDEGVRRVALEASSHGLAQYRLDGSRIDVAVLTQLGRDHLDYHHDERAYAAAKARLFQWPGLQAAVLNAGDAFGRQVRASLPASVRCLTYGRQDADLVAAEIQSEANGLALTLGWQERREKVRVPLLGEFNADNVLAAAAALLALGYGFDDVMSRLGRVRPVAGRMELFRAPGCPGIVIDYAHNAGALRAALQALRPHTPGRVWCLFGAGGDRDRGKRPLMGAAAAEAADRIIVTDDNPRGEDADAIVEQILAGMPAGVTPIVEHDRGQALARALKEASPDDLILLAGKGHETTQTRGDQVLAWSDRDAAAEMLAAAGGGGE